MNLPRLSWTVVPGENVKIIKLIKLKYLTNQEEEKLQESSYPAATT